MSLHCSQRAGCLLASLAVLLTAVIPAASPAAAAVRSPTVPTDTLSQQITTNLQFSPVRTTTGERVLLFVNACTRRQPLQAVYGATRGDATLDADLQAPLSTCSINAAATAGTVSAHWPSGLALDMTLTAVRTPTVTRQKLSTGCYLTTTTARMTARGRFSSTVEKGRFGIAHSTRATVELLHYVVPACGGGILESFPEAPGPGPTRSQLLQGRTLQGLWDHGQKSITGQNIAGYPSELFLSEPLTGGPVGTFQDLLELSVKGAGAFLPAANLASATLDFNTPFSSGALTFTAGRGCAAGVRARNGTLSGTATIDGPFGPIPLSGAEIGGALLYVNSADTNRCRPVSSDRRPG